MDSWEVTKVVFERVHALDPENASKIVGMVLINDNSEKEMIRLAFGPDHLLHSFVARARADLAAKPSSPPSPVLGPSQAGRPWRMPSSGGEHAPFAAGGEQMGLYDCAGEAMYPDEYDCWSPAAAAAGGGHRRSFSLSDAEVAGAWRPCMYFSRGFCKNGSSCRFLHGLPDDDDAAAEQREVAAMERAKAMAARPPQFMEPASFPFSPSPKGPNFLLHQHQQQQQSELQRSAAAMLLGGGEDLSRFSVRSPRMDRNVDFMTHASRQIYLTFPADSTFSEEDVSNYFSVYGPVQDVRIPYQQKRMFGFVTFVYPETVKIILSKGNPHFVCGARVLVKPYKEKGKVPDRIRHGLSLLRPAFSLLPFPKLHPPHHAAEFAGCMTPTALHNPKDPFDLQQPQIGPRMMLGDIAFHEAVLRRKLEEQQQAIELQRAIELQGRRFMGLQLLDLKNRGHHLGSPVGSPMSLGQTDGKGNVNGNGNAAHLEDVAIQDNNKLNSSSRLAMSAPAFSALSEIAAEGKHEEQQKEEDGDGTPKPKQAVNPGEGKKRESGTVTAAPDVACGFQESVVDHNLPESLLASIDSDSTGVIAQNDNISPHHVASSLFPPTSSPDLPPYNSCFFQVPRFNSGHEVIEL
ncbi:hypothetical protein EJB05_02039, partial [Eragrostis curvula]